MAKRISRDDLDKVHDYGLHIPTRTVFLETPLGDEGAEHGVGYAMLQRVAKNLLVLDAASDAPITLRINTEGGDVSQGMAVYDVIKRCRSSIIGLVVGSAESMGCVVLQACDKRIATPHSRIMYHAGSWDGGSMPFSEGKNASDFQFDYGEQVDRIVWRRCIESEHHPDMHFDDFQALSNRGIYLTPERAVVWGLLDSVET
jgi:ATP-dependent protease ClpP protease subunit